MSRVSEETLAGFELTASCLNTGIEINLELHVVLAAVRACAHAIAQFVLTIAKFIAGGLSRPSKCYFAFCTVSARDCGVCFW